MKYYRMKIENIRTGKRDTYVSKSQGKAPAGWKCIGVLGCYETPERDGRNDERDSDDE